MTMKAGDKKSMNGSQVEVLKVFKNGKVKIQFWVHTFGMVSPQLWTETVRADRLA